MGQFKKEKPIYYKTEEEIALMRTSGELVSRTLAFVAETLREGLTGLELDRKAEAFIRDHGGRPVFKGYNGFPATLCISRNEVVVHGVPDNKPFKAGDIISVDCGTYLNDFVGDCAYTFVVGHTTPEIERLLLTTRESLYKGIEQAVSGSRVGDISYAIQSYCESRRYGVVRDLVGHGVGRQLHEAPEVPNFGKRGKGVLLKEGLTLAIEPMINMGTREVRQLSDGWTIVTNDRKPSAHFEHSIVVRQKQAELLTTHEYIEAAIKNNSELYVISQKIPTFAA